VNIRKFVVRANHLDELVVLGTLSAPAASFLDACVVAGLNVLVAGGTQAGKTTMLNCLTAAVPARERVITCEEVFELKVPLRPARHRAERTSRRCRRLVADARAFSGDTPPLRVTTCGQNCAAIRPGRSAMCIQRLAGHA
jgi:Type II/IV secretion system protein